jgi:hypothetical protein
MQVVEIVRPAPWLIGQNSGGLPDVPVDTDDIDKFGSILGTDGAVKHAQRHITGT